MDAEQAQAHVDTLQTILAAAKNDDLAVTECRDRTTGASVLVLVAISSVPGDVEQIRVIPLARFFDGDPYEQLEPPNLDGLEAGEKCAECQKQVN
jgi:hypothetical protein